MKQRSDSWAARVGLGRVKRGASERATGSRTRGRVFLREVLLGCIFSSAALPGCESDAGKLGTESHFLMTCSADAECGSGLRCLDDFCTRSCWDSNDCDGLAFASTCVTRSGGGARICDLACSGPNACSGVPGTSCIDGACRTSSSGGEGQGGDTSNGGSSSTGSTSGGSTSQGGSAGSAGGTNVAGDDAGGSASGGSSAGGGETGGDDAGGTSSGGTSSGGAGGTSSGGMSSGGAGGTSSGGSGGASSSRCPAEPPESGSACNVESTGFVSVHCSWGDDPRPQCRTTAACQAQAWQVTEPAASCSDPLLGEGCPSTPEAGGECTGEVSDCWYDNGSRCWCSQCTGGSGFPVCQQLDPPLWFCQDVPEGCPSLVPQAGEPCDTDAVCGPDCETSIFCSAEGYWVWAYGNCPVCAAPDTPIATPLGERPIASLRVGDLVYSVHDGATVAVPLLRASSTPVRGHRVVEVRLEGGAVLSMSPGHPTADGRELGSLVRGDLLDDEHRVESARWVDYTHDRTYDILPDSSSGAYFAAGALVGSTLAAPAPHDELSCRLAR